MKHIEMLSKLNQALKLAPRLAGKLPDHESPDSRKEIWPYSIIIYRKEHFILIVPYLPHSTDRDN